MKRYIIIKLVFAEEVLSDLHDLMLGEYEKLCLEMKRFSDLLDAEVFFEDGINHTAVGRSFATVEYNFSLGDEEKRELIQLVERFFADGALCKEEMEIFSTLAAVRFLQTDGELVLLKE